MKNILITAACLFLLVNISAGQNARFVTSGTIEYDKTGNMHAIVDRMLNQVPKAEQVYYLSAVDRFKKAQSQFRTLKSTLTFGDNKSLFTPIPSTEPFMGIYTPIADQNSTTYTDFATGTITSQKTVFEATFLVKDSVRRINWKITDETQEIAGYTCRRANALVLDSIYVVAFYTNKIPVSGGPESFTGLPGMILKLAIPHENVIWVATKVTDTTIPPNTIVPPKKGKIVNYKGLITEMQSALKNAGPYKQAFNVGMAL